MQVYCLDSQFIAEMPKFVAGCLSALSAMVQLELPHVNVLTKVDLCKNKVCARLGVAGKITGTLSLQLLLQLLMPILAPLLPSRAPAWCVRRRR